MRQLRVPAMVLSAALNAAALPAAADVHQIGVVNISAAQYTHVTGSRFEGPVERLRFIADNDTVDCEHIIVTYRDGTSHDVFSGTLVKGGTETITFPEGDSRIRTVDFACKAENIDGARVAISAVSDGGRPEDVVRDSDVRVHAATGTLDR